MLTFMDPFFSLHIIVVNNMLVCPNYCLKYGLTVIVYCMDILDLYELLLFSCSRWLLMLIKKSQRLRNAFLSFLY